MTTAAEPDTTGDEVARAKPPFLKRVRIRNYKSIEFCDVALEPLTLFVGRNASGKSNFLDALGFIRDVMANGVSDALRTRGGWTAVASKTSATKAIAVELEVGFVCEHPFQQLDPTFRTFPPLVEENSEWPLFEDPHAQHQTTTEFVVRYGFQTEPGHRDEPLLVGEELRFRQEQFDKAYSYQVDNFAFYQKAQFPVAVPNWHQRKPSHLIRTSRRNHLFLSTIGNQPYIDLGEAIRSIGVYNFHPTAIRELQPPDPGSMLAPDGRNLASLIESVHEIDPDTVNRVRRYLSAIVDEISSFKPARYGEYETVRFEMQPRKGATTAEFDARSMSDGTLRVLASLMAAFQIHLPSGPSVVAIEEPETALHPAAMRALVDALDEATLRTQVLLTTHSADMLDNPTIRPENVRVVQMIDGRTYITPVDAASVEIVKRNLNTLGGLERDNLLELDPDDLDRQQALAREGGSP